MKLYRDGLGLRLVAVEEVPTEKVRAAFLEGGSGDGARIELLEPLGPEGPVQQFLSRRGPGLHHVAFRSAGLSDRLAKLSGCGFQAAGPIRSGAENSRVCFLHPKTTQGVLIELVEP